MGSSSSLGNPAADALHVERAGKSNKRVGGTRAGFAAARRQQELQAAATVCAARLGSRKGGQRSKHRSRSPCGGGGVDVARLSLETREASTREAHAMREQWGASPAPPTRQSSHHSHSTS